MRATQFDWRDLEAWSGDAEQSASAGLVLYFGARSMLAAKDPYTVLRRRFPTAHIVGCSTGGQMQGDDVSDDIITTLALEFADTPLKLAQANVADPEDSRAAGASLGAALSDPTLAGIFVLSDAIHVNASALVDGLVAAVGSGVPISGGLAGDGARATETLVGADATPQSGTVAAIGFYGDAIRFGHGSAGGWDVFGPKRRITKSNGNVLYEVDGKPALELYKLYLGPEEGRKLPGSALIFPMRISDPNHPTQMVVRTVLGVDHEAGSMTFGGDIPEGWVAQLMHGTFRRLCEGAAEATRQAVGSLDASPDATSVAILVSCIGRRLLMGQRIDEEIEAATAELPGNCLPVGFYAYGEIAPPGGSGRAQLHNQTMTVTVLSEKAA